MLKRFAPYTTYRCWLLFGWLLLCSGLLVACGASGSVGFTPNGLPLRISIDTDGSVAVSAARPMLVTPMGVFDVEGSVGVAQLEEQYARQRLLIVRVDGKATLYTLTEGQPFRIEFDGTQKRYKQVNMEHKPNGTIILELETEDSMVVVPTSAPPGFPRTFTVSDPEDHFVAVRAAPSKESEEITRLTPGSQVTCVAEVTGQRLSYAGETSRRWLHCPEVGGYIFALLLLP
ncbi:MAG: hypothetical protein Fur005_40570 [Roseiflexaceae bacterium]